MNAFEHLAVIHIAANESRQQDRRYMLIALLEPSGGGMRSVVFLEWVFIRQR